MPATPTNAAFIAAVQDLRIDGVHRHYAEPPASIDITDGPCSFPLMPSANQGDLVTSCVNMSKTRSVSFVIVVDATGQGTQSQNYDRLAGLMDNLETALDAMTVANYVDYDISTSGNFAIGDSEYWAIVTTITARTQ